MNWIRLTFLAFGFGVAASTCEASVEISTAATKNMTCSAGVCSPTAKNAVLNVDDLTHMLAVGDVKITTGAGAVTITIAAPFSWTSTSRLTLDAYYNVSFHAPVTVAGAGGLSIVTNDGGSNGVFLTTGKGAVVFWDLASSLVINGTIHTLVNDVKTLAADIAAHPSSAYALAKSYDAKRDGTYKSVPIPTRFTGKFEGLGNSIAHLKVQDSSSDEVGLFGEADSRSLIENITLTQLSVRATAAEEVGGLVGAAFGTIRNAHLTGSVTAPVPNGSGGGLAGINAGTISQSSTDCAVAGGGAAGLAGEDSGTISRSFSKGTEIGTLMGGISAFETGLVEDSYSTGAITADASVEAGGIAGTSSAFGIVERSFSTGDVTVGDDSFAGGIVGYIDGGTVDQSFATGAISVGKNGNAGGVIAGICGCEGDAGVTNSYAMGSVRGQSGSQVGGVIGFTQENLAITAAYSTGAVDGNGAYEGGFVGYEGDPGDVSTGYWDLDTSGISNPSRGAGNVKNDPGISGLTDTHLKAGLPAGFDPAIWAQSPRINNGYPFLIANPPPQ
jgi:hypothetical protein